MTAVAAGVGYALEGGALATRGAASNPETEATSAAAASPADSAAVASAKETPAASKAWVTHDETNEMDGTRRVVLAREADHDIPGTFGSERPTLFIRCRNKKTEVVVHVGTQIQNDSI